MSYKLDVRESKWLNGGNNKQTAKIGPGSYEGANTTQNTWNRVGSQETREASRGAEISGLGEARGSFYGESDIRNSTGKNAPFNSRIERADHERLAKQYNPGPGAYINVQKSSAFRNDFITKENVVQRKIFSQEQGYRTTSTGATGARGDQGVGSIGSTGANQMLSIDAYGNPSYTVKDGGTLKKKLQPYAADKTVKDGLNITKERLQQATAPGSYDIAGHIGGKPDPLEQYKKKTANERLRDLGMLPQGFQTGSS